MRRIGHHQSCSQESLNFVPSTARKLDFTAAQIFLGNPKSFGLFKVLFQPSIFHVDKKDLDVAVYAHAPYVLHAFAKPENRKKNNGILAKHLTFSAELGLSGYVLHMGGTSHYHMVAPESVLEGHYAPWILEELCKTIGKDVLEKTPLLLENCASGSDLSGDLLTINRCVNYVRSQGYNVRICLDTLHLYSWGQILHSLEGNLDSILENIALVHLNSGPLNLTFGGKRDRHDGLLRGCVPIETIVRTLSMLPNTPVILERDNFQVIQQDHNFVQFTDNLRNSGLTDDQLLPIARQMYDKSVSDLSLPMFKETQAI